jgi:hypothetical protein
MSPSTPTKTRPARNEREWQQLMRDKSANIVRTKADWQRLLKSKDNPLAGLEDKAVKDFTASLVFRNGGLAGANWGPVGGLSYRKFSALFGHFGLGMGLLADYEGYRCVGRADCYKANEHICTSNC